MSSEERRLHPLSLVFVLGKQLRHLWLPIVAGLFAARNSGHEEWWVIGLVGLTMVQSVFHYFTFRYRYDPKELVIRSGFFIKNERHIPYERIQNIDALQTIFHRALGVVTVLVQTGSGKAAEAKLAVLPMSALEEMRTRVFEGARSARGEATVVTPDAASTATPGLAPPAAPIVDRTPHQVLLHLQPNELILSGLIESRGFVILLSGFAFLSQLQRGHDTLFSGLIDRLPFVEQASTSVAEAFRRNEVPMREVLALVAVLAVLMIVLRVVSAVWTAVRLFDFRVSKYGEDLRVEHGFLTRVVNTIPLRRIQWVVVDETLLHRLLGRVAVRVTTAGGRGKEGEAAADREWLAPILPRAALKQLVETVQPGLDLDIALRRAHPRGFWRAITIGTVWALPLSLGVGYFSPAWGALVFTLLEIRVVIRAYLLLQNLGWATTSTSVIFRGGHLRRHTAGARFSRMQTVTYQESPFDRRTNMATVRVDTAGASGAHLEMQYLPRTDAVELSALLAAKTVETAFVW